MGGCGSCVQFWGSSSSWELGKPSLSISPDLSRASGESCVGQALRKNRFEQVARAAEAGLGRDFSSPAVTMLCGVRGAEALLSMAPLLPGRALSCSDLPSLADRTILKAPVMVMQLHGASLAAREVSAIGWMQEEGTTANPAYMCPPLPPKYKSHEL